MSAIALIFPHFPFPVYNFQCLYLYDKSIKKKKKKEKDPCRATSGANVLTGVDVSR